MANGKVMYRSMSLKEEGIFGGHYQVRDLCPSYSSFGPIGSEIGVCGRSFALFADPDRAWPPKTFYIDHLHPAGKMPRDRGARRAIRAVEQGEAQSHRGAVVVGRYRVFFASALKGGVHIFPAAKEDAVVILGTDFGEIRSETSSSSSAFHSAASSAW